MEGTGRLDWGLHEECGVFGISDSEGGCAQTTYYGLYALQHRGQEACGIAAINCREQSFYKDAGLVSEVFDEESLRRLKGTLAVVHNGNLLDVEKLRRDFEYRGAIFHTTSDSELIAYAIAQARLHCGSVEEAVCRATAQLRGAFSLLVMSPRKLIACRDPWGFRPLCMGRKGEAVLFASESCAIEAVGGTVERELEPGEIVVAQGGQVRSIRDNCRGLSHMCVFEYIYFARPDSVIAGQSVHQARVNAGRILAREHPAEADLVVGVPDSGLDAARGYALESGIPNGMGFVKNRYVGRTFITPGQHSREQAVRIKLAALRGEVAGKRVVMVDDSIVRGTTCRQIISLLREAGAREVHMRVSAPPFIAPCYFGTDIPDREKLIACHHTVEEIRELAGADSLGFLSLEGLHRLAPDAQCGFCEGCFTGRYPVAVN